MTQRIFLSGPMTGLPEFNFPAFHAAADLLRTHGHHVENPAENPEPPCGTWEGWMRQAIGQLVRCDTIMLLQGWQDSRGARIEHDLATKLGLRIRHYRMFELTGEVA
jgi:hypothetical protein